MRQVQIKRAFSNVAVPALGLFYNIQNCGSSRKTFGFKQDSVLKPENVGTNTKNSSKKF